jgi:hypothetical protein
MRRAGLLWKWVRPTGGGGISKHCDRKMANPRARTSQTCRKLIEDKNVGYSQMRAKIRTDGVEETVSGDEVSPECWLAVVNDVVGANVV